MTRGGPETNSQCVLEIGGPIIRTWMPIILAETAPCPKFGMAKAAPVPAAIFTKSRRFRSNFNVDYPYCL